MRSVLFSALLVAGCTNQWKEVQNATGDRLWLISIDRTVVIRCFDTTPNSKPLAGVPEVVCQEAYMRGARAPGEGK